MKLFSGPLSLFARKVEIALREKGLAFERAMVPFSLARPAFSGVAAEIVAADRELSAPVEGAFGRGKWMPDRVRR